MTYNTRLRYALRSITPKYVRNFIWEQQSLNEFVYEQRPKHRFLATLPVFVDELNELMDAEKVVIENNLISFTENGVEFESGTIIDHVDEVCKQKFY